MSILCEPNFSFSRDEFRYVVGVSVARVKRVKLHAENMLVRYFWMHTKIIFLRDAILGVKQSDCFFFLYIRYMIRGFWPDKARVWPEAGVDTHTLTYPHPT